MEVEEKEMAGDVEVAKKVLEEQNLAASSAAQDLLAQETVGQAEADRIRDSLAS